MGVPACLLVKEILSQASPTERTVTSYAVIGSALWNGTWTADEMNNEALCLKQYPSDAVPRPMLLRCTMSLVVSSGRHISDSHYKRRNLVVALTGAQPCPRL